MSTEETTTPQRVAIGLSFGNSYSSIAHTSPADGTAAVIANEEGDRQIPSILSYVSGEEFHGTQAKAQIVRNPRNTVAFFRDFIGKEFKDIDPSPCSASAHVVEKGGKVVFEVQEGEGDEKSALSVDEVTTRHIRRLKLSASDYLGRDVNAAVVTVPSDFGDAQKSALTAAASAAGVDILQYITEPVAALLAHDAKLQAAGEASAQDKVVLVADLGSSRSDVAVVASRGGIYSTLATVHDYELGGKNLDAVLIEYAAKEFLKKNKNATDPRKNERSLAKLTLESEAAKKALSIGATAQFSIESLADGIDFSLSVNRTRFDLLGNKVFASFTRLLESAVSKAGLDLLDIDEILLSGGSAHVPKVASSLASVFPESTKIIAPSTSPSAVNPSELAVRGAAMQASLISEFEKEHIAASTEPVVTVTPHLSHAIGLALDSSESDSSSFAVLVEPNTPVPVRRTAQISVPSGGDVLLRIAEGASEIKVTKQDPPPKTKTEDDDEDDEDEDSEDDEPEEIREKIWKAGNVLAELAIREVKPKGKVEVQINIAADLSVTVVAREVGGKGGVRGVIAAKA